LYEHLCGVASVLRAWKQPETVCVAGMFHSIYSTDKFQHATLSISERPRLQSAIGLEPERLVYLFASLAHYAVFGAAASWSRLFPAAFAEIPCRWDSSLVVRVSRAEMADLLLMHMANRIEQALTPATGIGFWLARMSDLTENLRALSDSVPEALANLAAVPQDDERRLHSLYLQGVALLGSDDPSRGLGYLESACRDCGFVGEPYLMLATGYRLLGNALAAQEAAARGRLLLEGWGTPWHKHLSMERWLALADLILEDAPVAEVRSFLRELSLAHDKAQAAATGRLAVAARSDGADARGLESGASRLLSYLRSVQSQRSEIACNWYPELNRKAWHDAAQFPVIRELESRFAEIRAEALKVEPAHYYEEAENIGRTGSWQVCMFYEHGRRNDFVCRQCPTIASVLDSHASIRRGAGLIYLSKMSARTHVTAHQAHSNLRVRCHLAINIPPGDCAIRVGDEIRRWREGKCIVFDDTFEHEVWNRTDQERLLLLVDLWHPDLTELEREALEAINWLSINKANKMIGAWQRNDNQRDREGKHRVQ
jgi:aspartate beta-hydroxylase